MGHYQKAVRLKNCGEKIFGWWVGWWSLAVKIETQAKQVDGIGHVRMVAGWLAGEIGNSALFEVKGEVEAELGNFKKQNMTF